MARVKHPPIRRFVRATKGIAAVEFALVMPVMVVFMLFGAEVARYVSTARQLSSLAASMATMVSARTTNASAYDLWFALNSTIVTFPAVLKDSASRKIPWSQDISVNLSSVAFTPTAAGCTANCTYVAKIVWSANLQGQGARSCTVAPIPVADSAPPSLSTLPTDVYNPGTLIIADVSYNFRPVFGGAFFPSAGVRITRAAYQQPRYLPEIKNVATATLNGQPTTGPTYNCP